MARKINDIRGRVVVITGGARGIGRATGLAFLGAGARVALGDIDVELAEKTAAEFAATGEQVCGLQLDVTSRTSFEAFLDEVESRLGPVDVVINNAGIMPTGLFADETDEMTDRMVAINLGGVLNGSKLAAVRMRGRGGHIVNVPRWPGPAHFPVWPRTAPPNMRWSDSPRRCPSNSQPTTSPSRPCCRASCTPNYPPATARHDGFSPSARWNPTTSPPPSSELS